MATEAAPLLVVADQPDVDGLGVEHAVGVEDEETATGSQYAVHLLEGFNGAGDILHGDGDDYGIEAGIGEGEVGVLVGVTDYVIVEVGVVPHLHRIQAQADHALFRMVFGPVGAIAAEQVQHLGVGRDEASQQVGDGGDGPIIYMHQQARLLVEEGVIALVLAAKVVPGEELFPANVPLGAEG